MIGNNIILHRVHFLLDLYAAIRLHKVGHQFCQRKGDNTPLMGKLFKGYRTKISELQMGYKIFVT